MVNKPVMKTMSLAELLEMCDREYKQCIKECEYIDDMKFGGKRTSMFWKICRATCVKKFNLCINKIFRIKDKQLIFMKP